MRLNKLVENAPAVEIKTLFVDSRQKVNKGLFFCMKGMVNDGHKFVKQAIRNGAVAIVHSDELESYRKDITYIKVDDVTQAMTDIVMKFHDDCTRKMKVFGVTGTNGKTTISLTIRNIVNHYISCGYIGTIGVEYNDVKEELGATTNDLITTMDLIGTMYEAGVRGVSMEVSSHGLDQHRVDGIDFDVAIFTNLTHEHLDYHGNMENYFETKSRFFTELPEDKIAIINADDEYGRRLLNMTKARVVTYGIDEKADYQAVRLQLNPDNTRFVLKYNGVDYDIETNLVARFNVSNLLAVIAALSESGMDLDDIIPYLNKIPQVDGRVEVINEGQNFNVIIDYAHTPDGFEKIYAYAKAITPEDKKIITVFGSAGRRDTKKRPKLGEISEKYCQSIVLTEEDSRIEDPAAIANDIAQGIEGNYVFVANRYDAIRQGIELANSGDTVLVLGKGDEEFMDREFGSDDWMGDNNAAREILKKYIVNTEEYEDGIK